MNEQQFAERIRQALNQGTEVRPDVSARLARARELALQRHRPEPATGLAWADNVAGSLGGWSSVWVRVLGPLLALAVGIAAVYGWQEKQLAAEIEELDAMLLTDELPLDAYLDRNFQNWLKNRGQQQ